MTDASIKETLLRLGTVVKSLRHEQGFSQEELAERSGLHRTYVTDVERGVRNISLDSITKLARALSVPLTDLFAKIEKPPFGVRLIDGAEEKKKPVEILLVEDNSRHVELVLHVLQKNGVSNAIFTLNTGEESLDFIFAQGRYAERASLPVPKLVLLDLSLPNISGLEVLRRIRSDDRSRNIAVVILTASRSDQDYKESMKLGVTAYITKPVDFVEFSTVMPKIGFRWQLVEHA